MLRIAELSNVCITPRNLPHPEQVRVRVDELMRRQLPESCSRILQSLIDRQSPELWFIRELNLDLAVDLGAATEDVVGDWIASRFARVLLRTMADGPDGQNVWRFTDRAEYVTRFAQDLCSGSAWDNWIYEGYDSLRVLPPGIAFREALLREPDLIPAVLTRIYRLGDLRRVMGLLSETDARLLLDTLTDIAPPPLHTALTMLLERWTTGAGDKEALRLAVETGFVIPPHMIRGWLAIVTHNSDAIFESADVGVAAAEIREHLTGDPELAARVTAVTSVDSVAPSRFTHRLTTPFGFLFLLLPHLTHISSAQLRFQVLLTLCGQERRKLALHDSALRLAAGLEENAEVAEPEDHDRELIQIQADGALGEFTARLIAFQQASPEFLYTNFFEGISHISVENSSIHVLLPLVPLRLVLRMAHFDDYTYQVGWLPGRTVHIRLPEEV